MNTTPDGISRFRAFHTDERAIVASPITTAQRNAWKALPENTPRNADVVIAGGGLSGVSAAVAASRRGCQVVLVEATHMVGGQATAAGVSAFDITHFYEQLINGYGLWSEILDRIQDIYDIELNRPVNVGHYRDQSFTPNVVVVERVLGEILGAEGVEVLRNTDVTAVYREGARITGLETSAGRIDARIVVDATEDGMILDLGGVPHRLATSRSNGMTSKPERSKRSAIQDITYTAIIQAYPRGIPDELVVREAPAEYESYLDKFRAKFPPTSEGARAKLHMGPLGFAGYRAAPDLSSAAIHTGSQWQNVTRTCLNYTNDYPVNADFLTDPMARLRYEAGAKLKTISLIYYLQNELGLPWSVSTDEGFADGVRNYHNHLVPDSYRELERHMPLIPYIRESRRVIGEETLIYRSIRRPKNRSEAAWRTDSIAVGTYPPDLHGGREEEDYESYLGETHLDKPRRWKEGPFPIPLACLIPEWTEGLLAAEKNISVSRLVVGAVRLHPTVTAIGEAAGVAAALAVRFNVQPRELLVAEVQYELARGGASICPLAIEGLSRDHPDFAEVSLAVARKRVPFEIVRPGGGNEPRIRTDLGVAALKGRASGDYLHRLQAQRLSQSTR
ncbi:FAD-dependent oxidoreductase [Zhihengliuella sp.]|uniref:FAD-dependent oxidoreductase n=1 Tax=Zhihengliuella sp. TaxID=1954483 RepID=UPI0028114260|nr:FAD-dependent oxidoreductase [Zhihengliuella sp.]